ncbi:MAG: hypothetical protein AABY51_06575 [Deltaproteobacteria bacterium]
MKKTFIRNIGLLALLAVFVIMPTASFAAGVRVAVLPWKVNSAENLDYIRDGLPEMLASRLGAKGSIEVIAADEVKDVIASMKVNGVTDKVAMEAAVRLNADYVVYGSLTVIGTSMSLDAQAISPATGVATRLHANGTGMDSIMQMVERISTDLLSKGLSAPVPLAGSVGVQAAPAEKPSTVVLPAVVKDASQEGFIVKPKADASTAVLWRSRPMEGLYTGFAVEDLDHDGVKEFFLLSDRRLVVAVRRTDGLKSVGELSITGGVSVASIDSDSDGSPEVYVSSVRNGRAETAIVEFKDGSYKVTALIERWLVRAMKQGDSGVVLLGQRFRSPDGFYGPLTILKKEGDALIEKGAFETGLPKRLSLYGFEAFDLTGSGKAELIALDERGHVRIYRKTGQKWEEAWKSREFFGGTLDYIEMNDGVPGAKPIPVETRAFSLDTDKDGRVELVVRRNIPGGLGRISERPMSFVTGAVVSLEWDSTGEDLAENWRTRDLKGYVADFVVADLDKDGADEITLLVVEGTEGVGSAPKSYLLSYRLSI